MRGMVPACRTQTLLIFPPTVADAARVAATPVAFTEGDRYARFSTPPVAVEAASSPLRVGAHPPVGDQDYKSLYRPAIERTAGIGAEIVPYYAPSRGGGGAFMPGHGSLTSLPPSAISPYEVLRDPPCHARHPVGAGARPRPRSSLAARHRHDHPRRRAKREGISLRGSRDTRRRGHHRVRRLARVTRFARTTL